MSTKTNPGTFDCYSKAGPDEEMFILLARDPIAPGLVAIWAAIREKTHGLKDNKPTEALACAQRMLHQNQDMTLEQGKYLSILHELAKAISEDNL